MGLAKDFWSSAMGKGLASSNKPAGLSQNNFNKEIEKSPSNRIDVSKGSFQINKDGGRFEVEKMLKNVVKDPSLRRELAGRLYEGRGGSGLSPQEIKDAVDGMWKEGKLNDIQSRGIKSDLGAYK